MTTRIKLFRLPKNSKRILAFLEYVVSATQTEIGRELCLNKRQMTYAMQFLRDIRVVTELPALGSKMSAKNISVNADTVTRSDIKEMIHYV